MLNAEHFRDAPVAPAARLQPLRHFLQLFPRHMAPAQVERKSAFGLTTRRKCAPFRAFSLACRPDSRGMRTVERVVIALSPQEFGRLTDLATQNDRDPYSQAQHLVRQAIGQAAFSQTPAGGAGFSPCPAPAAGPASDGSD